MLVGCSQSGDVSDVRLQVSHRGTQVTDRSCPSLNCDPGGPVVGGRGHRTTGMVISPSWRKRPLSQTDGESENVRKSLFLSLRSSHLHATPTVCTYKHIRFFRQDRYIFGEIKGWFSLDAPPPGGREVMGAATRGTGPASLSGHRSRARPARARAAARPGPRAPPLPDGGN